MLRLPSIMLTVALCAPSGLAQRMAMGAVHPTAPSRHGVVAPGGHRSSTRVIVGNGFGHRPFRRNGGSFGWPYFADYGFGYGNDSEPYEYPPPPPEPLAGAQPPPAVEESR